MVNVDEVLGELRGRLGIEYLGSQDSDLVGADPSRLSEFCDIYEKGGLDDRQRTALMALIVASLDSFLSEGLSDTVLEERVSDLVKRNFTLHRDTVEYWSKLREPHEGENLWSVTPLMRSIWREKV